MAESSIPVDVSNPGQVFACLGFLEAADELCGEAEGRFDWSDETQVSFLLRSGGDENPVVSVLEFLARARVKILAPKDWQSPEKSIKIPDLERLESEMFPSVSPEKSMAMPIQVFDDEKSVTLGHWADGSSRNSFKLYAGNRSARDIATKMLFGDSKTRGIAQLWEEQKDDLIERPFDITTPMGGSFNFDPRGAWTSIDAGYSPNDQKHQVEASPVVELLAAWGLENARPDEFEIRKVRYAIWGVGLQPILARVALIGGVSVVPMKRFRFELDMSGKNKVVTFAEQEITYG